MRVGILKSLIDDPSCARLSIENVPVAESSFACGGRGSIELGRCIFDGIALTSQPYQEYDQRKRDPATSKMTTTRPR